MFKTQLVGNRSYKASARPQRQHWPTLMLPLTAYIWTKMATADYFELSDV